MPAGNDTAVIIGEDYHRTVSEVWPEQFFTGRVEIVAVHERPKRLLCGSHRPSRILWDIH